MSSCKKKVKHIAACFKFCLSICVLCFFMVYVCSRCLFCIAYYVMCYYACFVSYFVMFVCYTCLIYVWSAPSELLTATRADTKHITPKNQDTTITKQCNTYVSIHIYIGVDAYVLFTYLIFVIVCYLLCCMFPCCFSLCVLLFNLLYTFTFILFWSAPSEHWTATGQVLDKIYKSMYKLYIQKPIQKHVLRIETYTSLYKTYTTIL